MEIFQILKPGNSSIEFESKIEVEIWMFKPT